MTPLSSTPSPGPKQVLDLNYAFAHTAMLMAAVRLHLFSYLADGACTPAALALRIGCEEDAIARLLSGLATIGMVVREGEQYDLTPVAAQFLVEGKPSYLGGDTLAMEDYIPAWLQLDATIRTQTPFRDLGDPATAEAFYAPRVRDLFPIVYPLARRLTERLELANTEKPLAILDVAAGSAGWSVPFAQRYPQAHVTAIDLPAVVQEGRQHVEDLGLSARFSWIAQDIFTVDLPATTYDVIIVAHLCRFIGEARSRLLFTRLFNSLKPGGTLVLADVLLADDRSGPAFALVLDLSMLTNTRHGHIFTFQDFQTWLTDAGFVNIRRFDVSGPTPVAIAQKGGFPY